MRLWAKVLKPDGSAAGDGPLVHVLSASVSRILDGAGSFSMSVPGTQRRALELLQAKRRVVLYAQNAAADGSPVRELGRGIIDDINQNDSGSGWSMSVGGMDILGELKYTSVLLNRFYNQQSVTDIVTSLVNITREWDWYDWHVSVSDSNLVSARYDGATVLKALQSLAQQQGAHLRLGDGKTVEFGRFGDDAGVTFVNTKEARPELYGNADIGLIERVRLSNQSEEVITWLLPLAGGNNVDSALTLEFSDRNGNYPISTMAGPDGRTLHFIQNPAAIARYGKIPKVGTYKEISPLTPNTDSNMRNGANTLYDAAVVTLERYSEPQQTFSLTVKKCAKTIRPGQKVSIRYFGEVEDEEGRFRTREIKGDYWVIKATERFGNEGMALELEVSNIDRYMLDEANVIIGGLEQIRIQGVNIQPTFIHWPYGPEQVEIAPGTPGKVQLIITDVCQRIDQVIMRIRTQPFTSTAVGGAAGGDHRHLVASFNGGVSGTGPALWADYRWSSDAGGSAKFFRLGSSSEDIWTYGASGDHTHPQQYGIYRDTQRPADMTVTVNGVNVTPTSPFGVIGADLDVFIDITNAVKNKAGGFRSVHDVIISCAAGRGEVLVTFDVQEIVSQAAFRPT